MPVTVTRNFVVKAGDRTIVLSPEEIQKSVETEVTVTCSGPRCQARNARPEPFSVTWKEEEAAKNPLALPDAFYTMIKMAVDPAKNQELVFCGRLCAADYLQYSYVPPQPPRIALENAKREQATKLEELNPHLVSGKTEYRATEIPATLPPHSGDTMKARRLEKESAACHNPSPAENQADGYVDQEADVHA